MRSEEKLVYFLNEIRSSDAVTDINAEFTTKHNTSPTEHKRRRTTCIIQFFQNINIQLSGNESVFCMIQSLISVVTGFFKKAVVHDWCLVFLRQWNDTHNCSNLVN